MNNLAKILSSQGNYSEAEGIHREVLQLCEKMLGKSHPNTLTSMNKMHRETLQLNETALGKSYPGTLASMNNLALVLSWQGHYVEAEGIRREALRLCEDVLGKGHPFALDSINNLTWVWCQTSDIEAVNLMAACDELSDLVL